MAKPVISEDGKYWLIRVEVAENYSVGRAARILQSTSNWLRQQMAKGVLVGENTTPKKPVDHDALVEYVKQGSRKKDRRKSVDRAWELIGQAVEQMGEEDA